MHELARLLARVQAAEDLLERAEAFYAARGHLWKEEQAEAFEEMLNRKRDLLFYEQRRLDRMGLAVASGRYPPPPNF